MPKLKKKQPSPARTIPGRAALLVILFIALAGAAIAQYYFYTQQRQTRELWGESAVWLIARGSPVIALELQPLGAVDAPVTAKGEEPSSIVTIFVPPQKLRVLKNRAVTHAVGVDYLRDALLHKSGYDWEATAHKRPEGSPPPAWRYGLTFEHEEHETTFLFEPDTGRIALLGTRAEAVLEKKFSRALADFLRTELSR
ncbi:MAG: hypothetical protein JSS27_15930 [Planctomycetes bacterium]|nr:hypothetical protein [Planctomycetota bacterium]